MYAVTFGYYKCAIFCGELCERQLFSVLEQKQKNVWLDNTGEEKSLLSKLQMLKCSHSNDIDQYSKYVELRKPISIVFVNNIHFSVSKDWCPSFAYAIWALGHFLIVMSRGDYVTWFRPLSSWVDAAWSTILYRIADAIHCTRLRNRE